MKAVIMAGGKGTRLMPLTRNLPKPMVNLIDKPVLEHVINLLRKHGVYEIAITLGYLADRVISYFGNGENLGVNLTYYVEEVPLGTAGGVKKAASFVGEDFLFFQATLSAKSTLPKPPLSTEKKIPSLRSSFSRTRILPLSALLRLISKTASRALSKNRRRLSLLSSTREFTSSIKKSFPSFPTDSTISEKTSYPVSCTRLTLTSIIPIGRI